MKPHFLVISTSKVIPAFLTTLFLSCLVMTSVLAGDKPVTITFYHTSDIHEFSDKFTQIAKLVADKRAAGENILFVDSGDRFDTGDLSPLFTRGEAISEMFGAAKYDAVVPGNHDYVYGSKRLAELNEKYAIPMVTANWPPQKYPPYSIHTFDGVRVGIIGIATGLSNYLYDKKLNVESIGEAVAKTVKELETKADIIILLTHIGSSGDIGIAKDIPRLDIIFGGHQHTKISKTEPNARTGTIIQHSGCYGESLGEVTLTWDGDKIVDQKMRLIEITDDMEPSEEMRIIVNKYKANPFDELKGVEFEKHPIEGHKH